MGLKPKKQQVTIQLETMVVTYFKRLAADTGIPYQVLINFYLKQCVREKKQPTFLETL